MSGEKRTPIQILQDEMRENRNQLYNIQKQKESLQQELAKVRNQHASDVGELKTRFAERDRKQAEAVGSLKSELRMMAVAHNQQMTKQYEQVMTGLQEAEQRMGQKVDNLREWTQGRLLEQRNEYKRISQQQQQQLNVLKRDIEHINQREQNREDHAKDYLADLELLIKSADENLPHERYAPGRLDKIKQQHTAALRQFNSDIHAAAIAIVQAAHFDLMDLEDEVRQKETIYELTYRTVADAVGGLLEAVRKNRNIQLEDNSAVQEADYWTNGSYAKLEEKVGRLNERIAGNRASLTVEDLNTYLDDLERLTAEQETLISEAVERIISSQLRAEMGDVIIERLGQQGYLVKNNEHGYAEADQRGPYMIKLCNVAGTEIVSVISPDEKTYQNTLSMNTYNEDVNDDAGRRLRNAEILNALQQGGLQLGETQSADHAVEAFYDVENLIKKGGKKLPAQVLQKAEGLSGPGKTLPQN